MYTNTAEYMFVFWEDFFWSFFFVFFFSYKGEEVSPRTDLLSYSDGDEPQPVKKHPVFPQPRPKKSAPMASPSSDIDGMSSIREASGMCSVRVFDTVLLSC